ncbi:Pycsar system effector family protein [Pseudarcicella hirudinis]
MFKSTSVNHFNLAALADHKAHIMISINAVIVSLVISILVRKLDDLPGLLIPIILLTIVSLLTIVFAILATRPKLAKGIFTQEQIDNKTANILYFGNFYKMELKDYESGINKMMNDSDFLYASMTKDLYDLGQILAHKYKMLRISYNIFMFGFVVSVIAFGISYFIDLN